jgi:hypothetical protein
MMNNHDLFKAGNVLTKTAIPALLDCIQLMLTGFDYSLSTDQTVNTELATPTKSTP